MAGLPPPPPAGVACRRSNGLTLFDFGDFSEGDYETPVFLLKGGKIGSYDDRDTNFTTRVLAEVKELRGIQERLLDASLSTPTNPSQGLLEMFLSRSESIVKEFVSTIFQHRQKVLRKSSNASASRRSSGTKLEANHSDSSHNRSLRYYESLFDQCSKLEDLLYQNVSQHEKNSNSLDLNEELTKVTIVYHDHRNRPHELVAELHPNFPSVSPKWTTDLPIEFKPPWKSQDLKRTSIKQDHSKQKNEDESMKDDSVKDESVKDATNDSEALACNNSGSIGLSFLYFIQIINKFQSFWEEMDDIDANLWILEPSLPSRRSSCERRIALREGVGIHLTIDHEHPRSPPLSMRLSGTSKDIKELRKSYQRYVLDSNKISPSYNDNEKDSKTKQWDEKISIRSNLEICFGFTLPSPASSLKSDFVGECGICYSHRLPTATLFDDEQQEGHTAGGQSQFPNILCSNSSCSRHYHESCLLEWLHSLPNVKVRFDRIHGTCPYCCESISVKLTSTRS